MSGARTTRGTRTLVRALRLIGEREAALRADGGLTLSSPKGGDPLALEAAEVGRMVSEGLLARRGERVARTRAGRAFLRRAMATAVETPYAEQHRARAERIVETDGERTVVSVNAAESPLGWLATRRDRHGNPLITAEQHEAGLRLHADHARGHQRDRVTQSWDASGVRGEAPRDRLTVTQSALEARRRVEAALDAVGPGLAEVLVAVCCEEVGLETVEKRQGWPARSGKVVLRLALDRLAAHYGIGARACGARRHPMVHWGTADYRPRA